MKYAALDFTNYGTITAVLFFVAMVLFLIAIATSAQLDKKKRVKASMAVLFTGLGLAVVLLIGSVISLVHMGNVNTHNRELATQSLMEKYDLKSVDWDDFRTKANEVSSSGDRNIVVTSQENQRYIFNYVMDHKTSEPTLLNMPIEGGKTPDRATTAEALLKDK